MQETNFQKIFWRKAFWWACALVMLLWVGPLLGFLDRLELYAFEFRQLQIQQDRSDSGIALIELDNAMHQKEVHALFGRFPFHRDLYGYVVRFLNRSGAERVMFDLSFTGGADPCGSEPDAFFAQSMKDRPRVFSVLSLEARGDARFQMLPDLEKLALLNALAPTIYKKQLPPHFRAQLHTDMVEPLPVLWPSAMYYAPAGIASYDQNKHIRRAGLFNILRLSLGTGVETEQEKAKRDVAENKGVYGDGGKESPMLNFPTMALVALAGSADEVKVVDRTHLVLGNVKVDLKGEENPIIRWYGDASPQEVFKEAGGLKKDNARRGKVYPRISFWEVVKSELYYACKEAPTARHCGQISFEDFTPLAPETFQGKYVYVGLTDGGFTQDNHVTLYNSQYPGVYAQANVLDNLIHNDFVGRAPWRVPMPSWLYGDTVSLFTWLTVLMMGGLTVYTCGRWHNTWVSLFLPVGLVVAYSLMTMGAYQYYNVWLNWVYPVMTVLVVTFATYVYRYRQTEHLKQQLRNAFGKYVSPAVMSQIEKNPGQIQLGGVRQEVTILFCDIRGFTSYSEKHSPEEVQALLTEYFGLMNAIILKEYGGTINKLIGDAIMAFWGFPLNQPDDALKAVSAAMKMREAMETWRQDPAKPPLHIGVGINTGEVVIGNIGSEDFMDFTIIGDAVNLASRLESATKKLGVPVVISESTYQKVQEQVEARFIETVTVAGKEEAIPVYEPLALKTVPDPTPS